MSTAQMKYAERARNVRFFRLGLPTSSLRPVVSSLLLSFLCACAPLPHREPRAAHSSYGCMRAAVRDRLPTGLPDDRMHCIAAGLIARHCSLTEATLASLGKELRDLLGPGDAQWSDLVADREGMQCARQSASDAALLACCVGTRHPSQR